MQLDQFSPQESVDHSLESLDDFSQDIQELYGSILGDYEKIISSIDISETPAIKALNKKILETSLKNNPKLEQKFLSIDLRDYVDRTLHDHPELWPYLTFDLWLQSLKNKHYSRLSIHDKLKLITLEKTLQDSPRYRFEKNTKNKDWKYDTQWFKQRYRDKFIEVISTLSRDFTRNQRSNFWFIKQTLTNTYWATEEAAEEYIAYLDEVKKQLEAQNPTQLWGRWYVVVAILAAILWAVGHKMYQDFMDPKGIEIISLDRISLWDPETLSKFVSAEQSFSLSAKKRKTQFDDDSWISRLANMAQSKEVIISLDGKIAVEYDVSSKNWASYYYNPQTQIIEIVLPSPSLALRDSQAKVLNTKRERIQISDFNNLEFELIDNMKEEVLRDDETKTKLIDLSVSSAASLFYEIYAPIIESNLVNNGTMSVQGVTITVQNPTGTPTTQQQFSKNQLSALKN